MLTDFNPEVRSFSVSKGKKRKDIPVTGGVKAQSHIF
jgi:hypothetical protein